MRRTNNKNIFALRLTDLMRQFPKTQSDVAEAMGVKRQAVGQYCNGATVPTIDKLVLLARYFNVSADYLLGITDDPNPSRTEEIDAVYCAAITTGLNCNLIRWLHHAKSAYCFNVAVLADNYILIDIKEREAANVETDA